LRELDRYLGFRPSPDRHLRPEPAAEDAVAFGAEPESRPEIPVQDLEKIDSAPGILAIAEAEPVPAASRSPG